MSDLYENMLKATNNLKDMVFSRYATVTEVNDDTCTVKEKDNDLQHIQIPVTGTIPVKKGDTVLIGFVNNDLYQPYIMENMDSVDTSQETLIISLGVGLFKINNEDKKLYVELPVNVENFFKIEDGVLYVNLPEGTPNNYELKEDGILYYERWDI